MSSARDLLSELSPMVTVPDEQDPHAATHDVASDTSRPIRRRSRLLLQELLCTL